MNRCTASGLAIALLMFVPVHGMCQSREAADVHLRNDCRLARQVLTTGEPHTRSAWALDRISLCDETGPEALASLWASPRRDTVGLGHLIAVSAKLRDARLDATLRQIAGEPTETRARRLAALEVLVSWAVPGLFIPYQQFLGDESGRFSTRFEMMSVDHPGQSDGVHPLPPGFASDLHRWLAKLAADETDPGVRRAAEFCVGSVPVT
ncbi:MAG: hypothetical protein JWM27_3956 [Gemmatimonadetes bacterium]|nr:hypothetical protein [Gemmatimonadota bacterium]